MTLLHALPGRSAPLLHCRRPRDGLRGVCAARRLPRGAALLSVPLRRCYFPHACAAGRGARLRRWNRAALFPEAPRWLAALPAAALRASASTAGGRCRSLRVAPAEAALAVAVALRHFWAAPARGKSAARIGPPPARAAELYVRALPIAETIARGVEGLYAAAATDGGALHVCAEQIAANLRDAVLDAAGMDEYRVYDENAAELDETLLAALYVVRSRVLRVAVVHGADMTDGVTTVIAPLVDMLNHSAVDTTAAACVSLPTREVVVRAMRNIEAGEEITLNYRGPDNSKFFGEDEADADDEWESRYLFSANDA